MHEYLLSVFLGIVEGLTEFLPVSSTAHLRICEALLHIDLHDGFWKMYTIVIQLGAILALPVYFWNRIIQFVRTFPRGERGNRTIFTHPLSLTLIAFVVTAVPAWALTKQIGKNLENLWGMAFALLIGEGHVGRVGADAQRRAIDEVDPLTIGRAVRRDGSERQQRDEQASEAATCHRSRPSHALPRRRACQPAWPGVHGARRHPRALLDRRRCLRDST